MEVLKTNRQRQAIAEATTCVVMEALKTNRETDNTESRNLHGYGSTEDQQTEKEITWKATTYTVMEVLKTNREIIWEAATYTVMGVLKTNRQRNRHYGKQQPTRLWKY